MVLTPVIQTARITLRPFTLDDAPAAFKWCSSPKCTRFLFWLPHRTVDDTKRLVAVWVRKKLHLSWALEIGGQAEGEIEIIKDLPEKGFMLGYILSEECWGQGYMSEALQAVLKHMFANGYEYAMAETDTENLLSSKLLIHNGFQVVLKEENRYIAKKKTYVDVFQFRLTKAAYEKALK